MDNSRMLLEELVKSIITKMNYLTLLRKDIFDNINTIDTVEKHNVEHYHYYVVKFDNRYFRITVFNTKKSGPLCCVNGVNKYA